MLIDVIGMVGSKWCCVDGDVVVCRILFYMNEFCVWKYKCYYLKYFEVMWYFVDNVIGFFVFMF